MDISKMSEKEIMNCLNNRVPPIYELIMDLSGEQQTDAVIKRAVEIQPSNLGYIKKDSQKTDEIVLLALKGMGYDIPKDKLKENLVDIVKKDKLFFSYLPERLRDKQLCDIAIEQMGQRSLLYIPPNILTEEMCYKALHDLNKQVDYLALKAIPYPSVCLDVLKTVGEKEGAYNLTSYFNPNAINSEVANEAVRQELSCIALIPPGIKYDTPQMTEREKEDIKMVCSPYFEILRLKNLPVDRRTEIVSFAAVMKNADNFPDVPQNSRSDRVIETALKKNGSLISILFPDEITENRQLLALKNLPYDLPDKMPSLPFHLLDENACKEIVSRSPYIIKYLPEDLRTPRVYQAVLTNLNFFDDNAYKILPFIPADVISLNLNKLGWQGARNVLQSIKPEDLTPQIIEWAINRSDTIFKLLPADKLTAEHCLLQEKRCPGYFQVYPDQFPKHINNNEGNIYDLNRLVEDMSKEHFTFQQIKDLYEGKRLDGRNKSFIFNPKDKSLRVFEYRRKKAVKPKEEQKPIKGKRIKR